MLQAAPSRHRCLRLCSSTVWRTSCLATERSHSGLNSTTEWWTLVQQRLLTTVQTVGNTEEITQVHSFDKVDMASPDSAEHWSRSPVVTGSRDGHHPWHHVCLSRVPWIAKTVQGCFGEWFTGDANESVVRVSLECRTSVQVHLAAQSRFLTSFFSIFSV